MPKEQILLIAAAAGAVLLLIVTIVIVVALKRRGRRKALERLESLIAAGQESVAAALLQNIMPRAAKYVGAMRVRLKVAEGRIGLAQFRATGAEQSVTKAAYALSEATTLVDQLQMSDATAASTFSLLGECYGGLASVSDPETNLSNATGCYRRALSVPGGIEPVERANTEYALGDAYAKLSNYMDAANNLQLAGHAFNRAAALYPEQGYEYARVQAASAMADTLGRLAITRDTQEDLIKAIAANEDCKLILSAQSDAATQAAVDASLARSYVGFVRDADAVELVSKSIHTLEAALKGGAANDPLDRAKILNDLANAHRVRFDIGDNEEDIVQAIELFGQAIQMPELAQAPTDYGAVANNMGLAFASYAGVASSQENLKNAVTSFETALSVYAVETYPQQHKQIEENLAKARILLSDMELYYADAPMFDKVADVAPPPPPPGAEKPEPEAAPRPSVAPPMPANLAAAAGGAAADAPSAADGPEMTELSLGEKTADGVQQPVAPEPAAETEEEPDRTLLMDNEMAPPPAPAGAEDRPKLERSDNSEVGDLSAALGLTDDATDEEPAKPSAPAVSAAAFATQVDPNPPAKPEEPKAPETPEASEGPQVPEKPKLDLADASEVQDLSEMLGFTDDKVSEALQQGAPAPESEPKSELEPEAGPQAADEEEEEDDNKFVFAGVSAQFKAPAAAAKPKPEPEPEPEAEPAQEEAPAAEEKPEPEKEPEGAVEPPVAEEKAEPEPEPEPEKKKSGKKKGKKKEKKPEKKPDEEPEEEKSPVAEEKVEPEPQAEPKPEPEREEEKEPASGGLETMSLSSLLGDLDDDDQEEEGEEKEAAAEDEEGDAALGEKKKPGPSDTQSMLAQILFGEDEQEEDGEDEG